MTAEGNGFKTPGQILRETREARGIDRQEMADRTSIPLRLLEALEIDDYAQLSGDLYVRSFLRSCAKELGLDPQDLLDRYQGGIDARRAAAEQEAATWEAEVEVEKVGGFPWTPVLRGAAIAAAVLVIVLVAIRLSGPGGADEGTGPAAIQTAAAPSGGDADTSAAAAPPPAEAAAETPDVEPAAEASGEKAAETETAPTEGPAPDAAAPGGAAAGDEAVAESGIEPASRPPAADMPAGDPTLVFADGRRRSLVLRIVGPSPLAVAVAADGTRLVPLPVPGRGAISPLPESGVESGRLYRARDRYVAYWGGDDYFYLRLDDDAGVSVTLNGASVAIPPGVVGREWELNAEKAAP